jgi:organic radical activating enzyme
MSEHIVDRIDKVTKIPSEYMSTWCPPPMCLKISISSFCNHRCRYCALGSIKQRGQLSKQTYSRIVDEAAEMGVKELGVFFMGEPTACDWIGEAVAIAKTRIPYVFMTSNGTLPLAVSRYEECMKAGLDSLKFSLNYSDAWQYTMITRCDAKGFHDLIDHIKQTRELRDHLGAPTKLWASSVYYDGEQQKRMTQVIAEVEPYLDGAVYFLPLYSFGGWTSHRTRELGFKPTPGNQGRVGALREPLPCWTCFTAAHVGVTADNRPYLTACCFDAEAQCEIADLSQVSLKEAWNAVAFQDLRAAHLRKDVRGTMCEDCLVYE